MAFENVSVSIADGYLDQFAAVVRRCKKAGLRVEQQLKEIGIVTGSIDSARLDDLSRVEGVAGVERSRVYQIAPPDSEIQ
jgi:hypothetical protein